MWRQLQIPDSKTHWICLATETHETVQVSVPVIVCITLSLQTLLSLVLHSAILVHFVSSTRG